MMRQKITQRSGTGVAPPVVPALQPSGQVVLPKCELATGVPLEVCLRKRRSFRDFSDSAIQLEQLSQLLWSAQGITGVGGLRTAPSAGATYPLRTYVLAGNVSGLPAGFYSYDVDERRLDLLLKGDKRQRFSKACGDQHCAADAAVAVVLTAWYKRLLREYGPGSERLAFLEAGHIAQNWYLAATALGLGAVVVAKKDTVALKMLLHLPDDEDPVYIMLAGNR